MRIVIFLLFLVTSASAQQLPTEYTIKVTPDQLNIMVRAIEKEPYRDVAQLMEQLGLQIMKQRTPAVKPEDKK